MARESKIEKVHIRVHNSTLEKDHLHQNVELLMVLEGTLEIILENTTAHLKADDIFVINANKKHRLHAEGKVLFVEIAIAFQLLSDVIHTEELLFVCDSTKEHSEHYEQLKIAAKKLINYYFTTNMRNDNFGYIGLCYQMLDILQLHFLVKKQQQETFSESEKRDDRIEKINTFIRNHYDQPISLKDLSAKLYLCEAYMSRFFKKTYGMTFMEYLTSVRVFHAIDDLLYTDHTITQIANDNGFPSVAAFNKAYKKDQGETPSETRKRLRQSEKQQDRNEQEDAEILEKEAALKIMNQYYQENQPGMETMSAPSQNEEYEIHLQVKAERKKFVTINIGEAAGLLKAEVQEHVMMLKSLGFQYVRIWNLFSPEMLLSMNSAALNFARLDVVLDFLVEQNMKPHLELWIKPQQLTKRIGEYLFYNDSMTFMKNPEEWKSYIESLMQHLARRYGVEELDTWRLELWFPEAEMEMWKQYCKGYLKYFEIVYTTAHKYSDKIEVGGCGLRLDTPEEMEEEFLQLWKSRTIQPDFLSTMFYAYRRIEDEQTDYAKQDTDDNAFFEEIRRLRGVLEKVGMTDPKLYVTEYNLSISDRNYINDTCILSAYLLKNMIQLYDEVDDLVYFWGSDRITEYFDSNLLLHGGRGILSKNSILKPSGFMFDFWNRQQQYLIAKENRFIVTGNGADSISIFCHNSKKLNMIYYMTKEDEIEKENIWKYYEDHDFKQIQFNLNGFSDGTYRIKTYSVDEKSGSILDLWKQVEFEDELSRNDVKHLRNVCEPRLSIRKTEVKEGKLSVDLTMSPNQISIIRVQKLL